MAKLLRVPESEATFGQAIRWAREQRGLTLRQLGALVGVSAPFLCDIEHDRRETSRAGQLAKALGVTLTDLEKRQGITTDFNDWLSKRPDLIRALREIRRGKAFVLKGGRRG